MENNNVVYKLVKNVLSLAVSSLEEGEYTADTAELEGGEYTAEFKLYCEVPKEFEVDIACTGAAICSCNALYSKLTTMFDISRFASS